LLVSPQQCQPMADEFVLPVRRRTSTEGGLRAIPVLGIGEQPQLQRPPAEEVAVARKAGRQVLFESTFIDIEMMMQDSTTLAPKLAAHASVVTYQKICVPKTLTRLGNTCSTTHMRKPRCLAGSAQQTASLSQYQRFPCQFATADAGRFASIKPKAKPTVGKALL